MAEPKKRRRTGCLTCRARRIKCDEAKPTCDRCEAANLACAGYEPKRSVRLPAGRRRQVVETTPPQSSTSPSVKNSSVDHGDPAAYAASDSQSPAKRLVRIVDSEGKIHFRDDGLPLIGLPNNPGPDQRPSSRARDVLAYHQFLFRTLPVLFPENHMSFWRDHLCYEAWGTEFLFLAITALGGIHRATLLLSMVGERDRIRGLDAKVVALQTHALALKDLSTHQDEAEKRPHILTGCLILMAYFEAYAGNTPATIRHIQSASYYMEITSSHSLTSPSLRGTPGHDVSVSLEPLQEALDNLRRLCRVALPLPTVSVGNNQSDLLDYPTNPRTVSIPVDELMNIITADVEIECMIWVPALSYIRPPSPLKIRALQTKLQEWKAKHYRTMPQLDPTTFIPGLARSALDTVFTPPTPYSGTSPRDCLAGALWNFFMGRATWGLAIQGVDASQLELTSYRYFYEALTFVETYKCAMANRGSLPSAEETYIACEAQGYGFVPLLRVIGQCCPNAAWLRAIVQATRSLGYEGLFCAVAGATSLEVLQSFELLDGVGSPLGPQNFPPPASRIITILIPEPTSRTFVAYYARPKQTRTHESDGTAKITLLPLGYARWQAGPHVEDAQARVDIHRGDLGNDGFFNNEFWPFEYPVVSAWLSRLHPAKFNFDEALRDHITWSEVLFSIDDPVSP